MNQIASHYIKVDATIWLAKGDHFFFYCDEMIDLEKDGKPNQNKTSTEKNTAGNDNPSSKLAPLRSNILCSLKSLKAQYPKTDNINLVVRALDCEEGTKGRASKLDKAFLSSPRFRQVCVELNNKTKED